MKWRRKYNEAFFYHHTCNFPCATLKCLSRCSIVNCVSYEVYYIETFQILFRAEMNQHAGWYVTEWVTALTMLLCRMSCAIHLQTVENWFPLDHLSHGLTEVEVRAWILGREIARPFARVKGGSETLIGVSVLILITMNFQLKSAAWFMVWLVCPIVISDIKVDMTYS